MKRLLLFLSLLNGLNLSAQESAADYLVPTVKSEIKLLKITSSSLYGDLTKQSIGYSSMYSSMHPRYNEDGSVTYKIICFDDLYGDLEDHAYFVKMNGTNAALTGYSDYVTDYDDYFFDVEFVVNEKYTELSGSNYIKVPGESYQTQEWTFVNTKTNMDVKGYSYYKNMTFNGADRRILVVEFTENGKTTKDYYAKNFGLVAKQKANGDIYVVDFKNFNLYEKSFIDSKTEPELRTMAWGIIKRMKALENGDSFYKYTNTNRQAVYVKLDSLSGLFEHLFIKTPSMAYVYKYMIGVYLKDLTTFYYENMEKANAAKFNYSVITSLLNDYYLQRPHPEHFSKSGLSSYVTAVDENFYLQYWKTDYVLLKSIVHNSDFEKSYKVYLMKPFVDAILRYESTIGNVDKCILNSYLAIYYDYQDMQDKRYHHLVISVENYRYLTQADKDLNIEYMRTVMKTLSELTPGNESDVNRAIDATLDLKDYSNAVKIANNGYVNNIGTSLEFAFRYAKAAFNDELNKDHLRTAMKMMDGKFEQMNKVQLQDYIQYCQAMRPEFDCSKASESLEKIEKKERKEAKSGGGKSGGSKGSYSSGRRALNFAVMANPFAGLNLSGQQGFFKFLPMSATLRIKGTVHEFRYNPFFGVDMKNRFVGGKLNSSDLDKNDGWKQLTGADYGYSLIFAKNEIKSYSKSCASIGGGLNVIYGDFASADETIQATINNIPSNIIVRPRIKRYEGLFVFNMNYFDWKTHTAFNMYYGFGAGTRELTYGNYTFSQETLSDPDKTVFEDRRFEQSNWNGAYFTFRMGFRFGITIF